MKNKIAVVIATVFIVSPLGAHAVVVGNNDWRQLTETTHLSWNDVSTVCSTITGACSGSLGTVSFDGWTWADNAAVKDLFDEMIRPATTQFFTNTSGFSFANDPDIDAAIDPAMFLATGGVAGVYETLNGISRSLFSSASAYNPYLSNWMDPALNDGAHLSGFVGTSATDGRLGVWLYRPIAVAEPAGFSLLVAGLAGLAFRRKRFTGV